MNECSEGVERVYLGRSFAFTIGRDATLRMAALLPSRFLRGFSAVDRHQDDAVRAALVDQQVAVPRRSHVSNDAGVNSSGGNGPALKSLCRWVESDERIGPLARFIVPDDAVHNGDGIGVRLRPAGRRPLFNLSCLRIHPAQPA